MNNFAEDISKYTNNKKCKEHFTGFYEVVWINNSHDEKIEIVKKFEFRFPGLTTDEKPKTKSELKSQKILSERIDTENKLQKFN